MASARELLVRVRVVAGLAFAAGLLTTVVISPRPGDCTAHQMPLYLPIQILMQAIWLGVAAAIYSRRPLPWSWPNFLVGGAAGPVGTVLLVGFVVPLCMGDWHSVDFRPLAWAPILDEVVRYGSVSGLFAASRSSLTAATALGLAIFVAHALATFLVELPWMCVY
jgi:hypothetical protein